MVALSVHDIPILKRRFINHDIMRCTAEGVKGNYLYSGRALGMTQPEDILQLHPDLHSQWEAIVAHYDRIGLTYTKQIIWSVDLNEAARHPNYETSFFFFGEEEHSARQDENWFQVVKYINSKNHFMALAKELGMPIPETYCFNDVHAIPEENIVTFPYPCFLKASVSVSGVGIYRCEDAQTFRYRMACFTHRTPVQVQIEVRTDIFLNLQYRVCGSRLERLAATEQILDGYAHQGNRFPTPYDAWDSVEPMARWLFSHGIKDIFAFDVAIVGSGNNIRYFSIECNPRFNGATYPTLIAEKLGIQEWVARTFSTNNRKLDDIDLRGIEFDPRTGVGVIIVNWGSVLVGRIVFLLAGPPVMQQQLRRELEARL